jgi:hypothetical protein
VTDADKENEVYQVKPPHDHITHPGGDEAVAELYNIGIEPPENYCQKKQDEEIIAIGGLN